MVVPFCGISHLYIRDFRYSESLHLSDFHFGNNQRFFRLVLKIKKWVVGWGNHQLASMIPNFESSYMFFFTSAPDALTDSNDEANVTGRLEFTESMLEEEGEEDSATEEKSRDPLQNITNSSNKKVSFAALSLLGS